MEICEACGEEMNGYPCSECGLCNQCCACEEEVITEFEISMTDWIEREINQSKIGLLNWREAIQKQEISEKTGRYYEAYFYHRLPVLFGVYVVYAHHHDCYTQYRQFCDGFGSLNELLDPGLYQS